MITWRRSGRAALLLFLAVAGLPTSALAATDFKQCANNETSGTVTGLGNCHWIGSILQSNNSRYFEGMSVPQRLIFTGITATAGNVHTLVFEADWSKAGIHAYDWLTSYDQVVAAAATFGITLSLNPCGEEIGSLGPTCSSLRGGSNMVAVDVPDDSFVSQEGSTQMPTRPPRCRRS